MNKKKKIAGFLIILAVLFFVGLLTALVLAFYDDIPVYDDGGALISPNGNSAQQPKLF